MDAVLVLRTFGERKFPAHTSYLAYVPQAEEAGGGDWVFGGRCKTQDDPLATAWIILSDVAAQVARRLESLDTQLEFDLT